MNKLLLPLTGMLLSAHFAGAQIVTNQQPRSFSDNGTDTAVPTVSVSLPVSSKSATDSNVSGPLCFGRILKTDIDYFGNADVYSTGTADIYRLGLTSPGAYSLGLGLTSITLEDGVEMYIYNNDKSDVLGAITSRNNKKSRTLRTAQITGDSITIELYVPKGTSQGSFKVSKLIYDFKDIMGEARTLKKSSTCSIEKDINCDPGLDYQDIKHAVVKYTYDDGDYEYLCTGTLVNNYKNDRTPYILTAAHCLCSEETAEAAVFYFNYERPECGSSSKPTVQSIEGAELLATAPQKTYGRFSSKLYPTMDFTLLKLSEDPPADYQPYFAGFTTDTSQNLEQVALIHHPEGDYKKISISDTKPYEDTYPNEEDDDCNYDELCHWHIAKWSVGTTEGGSSGSALLNTDKKVVGMLSGGYADCSDPVDDYFQMFSKAWECQSDSAHQLKYWLAGESGISDVDPLDPYNVCANYRRPVLTGTVSADTTSVTLSWQVASSAQFEADMEDITGTSDIEDVFLADVDMDNETSADPGFSFDGKGSPTSWVLLSGMEDDYKAHSGSNCLASFTASATATNDYLTLNKESIASNMVLKFWAKSVGGSSALKLSQNTKPSRYKDIDTFEITEEWTEYSIPLSDYASSSIYINFDNITEAGASKALLIDDITISASDYEDEEITGYIVYNNESKTEIDDPAQTTIEIPVSKNKSYTFYVRNVFGNGATSYKSNILTYSFKTKSDNTPTPVSDITPSTGTGTAIYPNPTTDVLYFQTEQDISEAVLVIANMAGQLVSTKKVGAITAGTPYELNVKALKPGPYILILLSDKKKTTMRFVVD